ncbi:hypothetical protein PS15m_003648 [Mucor circinelloides]
MVSTTLQSAANTLSGKQITKPIISFIGGGNMAEAILCGLQSSGHPSKHLRYSEPFEQRRQYMQSKYPEMIGSDNNQEIVDGANVVILAVKPQVLRSVVSDLKLKADTLIVSIAAGITTADIYKWMNTTDPAAIVRCMPNTPALVGEGAVGLFATDAVNEDQRNMTEDIMKAVAKQVSWVEDESLIDTVTGISGSGPAYFFLIMEAMQNAGIEAGLSSEDAKALTLQTCIGAARMALTSEDDLATLRRKVTSPKGTTEAAINSMESNNIRKLMADAVFSAQDRGRELAEQLGKEL